MPWDMRSVHLSKESGGREILIRRKNGNDSVMSWESRSLTTPRTRMCLLISIIQPSHSMRMVKASSPSVALTLFSQQQARSRGCSSIARSNSRKDTFRLLLKKGRASFHTTAHGG